MVYNVDVSFMIESNSRWLQQSTVRETNARKATHRSRAWSH
jgi:hypothetical protein